MTLDKLMAVGAFNEARSFDLPVGRAGIPSRLRNFTLRYCHIIHLLFRADISCSRLFIIWERSFAVNDFDAQFR